MSQITQGGHSQSGNLDPESIGNNWDDSVTKLGEYKPIKKVGKSFGEHAAEYPPIIDGMEVSDRLSDMVQGFKKSFDAFETELNAVIDAHYIDNDEFDKSLGHIVLSIGEGVDSLNGRIASLEDTADFNKSFSGQPDMVGDIHVIRKGMPQNQTSKQEILNRMFKAVEDGTLDSLEVVKFDMSGEIDETVAKSLNIDVQ